MENFSVIMYRTIGGKWGEFQPPVGYHLKHTPKALREWMKKNDAEGWNPDLLRLHGTDEHTYSYGERMEFWIPEEIPDAPTGLNFWTPKKGDAVNIRVIRDVTCVNDIGCALTVGKKYDLKGEEDGLVQVVDDNGEVQSFLPERFTGAGMKQVLQHWLPQSEAAETEDIPNPPF